MSIRPRDARSFSLEAVFDKDVAAAPRSEAAPASEAAALPALPALPATSKTQLTFTLPVLKTANTPVLKPQNNAHRVLSAGFLVGGGHASVAETTRLRAVVEETQAKLKKTQERLVLTEQSVARGNAALASERAVNHARVVALTSQLKNAADAQADAQAKLKNAPTATNSANFAAAVKGAVDVSERTEALERHTEALQQELAQRTSLAAEHEALLAEHEALNTQLQVAKASFAEATETSECVKREALLMVKDAEARAESAEAATGAAEATAAKAAEVYGTENNVSMAFHTSAVCDLREELVAAQRYKATAEQKSLEADEIIKSLDAKLALLRSELNASATKAATTEAEATAFAAPMVYEHKAREFEHYALLKARAEEALTAGHHDAAFLHHAALQQYATLATPKKAAVFLCCLDEPEEPEDLLGADTTTTTTALAIQEVPLFGRGIDDACDLFGSTKQTISEHALAQYYLNAIKKDVVNAVTVRQKLLNLLGTPLP